MILGLKVGTDQSSNPLEKEKAVEAAKLFKATFIKHFDSLSCKDLIGFNVKIPEEEQKAIESGIFKSKCPLLVEGSIDILDSILEQNRMDSN
jgi:hypothetical protein